jgi:hypothetical protein
MLDISNNQMLLRVGAEGGGPGIARGVPPQTDNSPP